MKYFSIAVLAVAMAGCGTYYQDVPTGAPHATISIVGSRGLLGAQTITPMFVNGVPANGRNNQRTITVPPGPIELVLLWDHSYAAPVTRAGARLAFVGEAGKKYVVSGDDRAGSFTFNIRDESGNLIISKRVEKEAAEYRPFYP